MNAKLKLLMNEFHIDETDGVFSSIPSSPSTQSDEIKLRQEVASSQYDDYLTAISKSHSIPVMDYEIKRFLSLVPLDGVILDIGGCWGWHWRKLHQQRPDVSVVIVDFVRENFEHTKRMLGKVVGNQIVLMHADATRLPFQDADKAKVSFDAIWSVQTYQHIPSLQGAVLEAFRVLSRGGMLSTYSLHRTPLIKCIYRLFGKRMHTDGEVVGTYLLNRGCDAHREIISDVFEKQRVVDRYTECLFHPDLKFSFAGKENSMLGRIDILLTDSIFSNWMARQRSFEVRKK